MKSSILAILCGVTLLLCLVPPTLCAVSPLWTEPGPTSGGLSGVVISADGSTVVSGGDLVISLSPEGRKRWGGWSATSLAISSHGDYILASKGQTLRLISGSGDLIWEKPLDITITEVAMTPDASLIAAAGGGRIRLLKFSGEDIASNASIAVNHIAIMPGGDRILVTTKNSVQISNLTLIPDWMDTTSAQNLVAVAPDGSAFVTAAANHVRMYTGTGKLLWDKKAGSGNAEALAWSRDGTIIAVGLDDNSLQVLSRAGSLLWTAKASNWITSIAVSDNGDIIVTGSMDKKLSVYTGSGTKLGTFTARSAIMFHSVAMTGDGSLIILVDDAAVYAFPRSLFTEGAPDVSATAPATTPETTPVLTTATTARKVTSRSTLPTPYPTESEPAETPLPAAVPLAALGLGLLFLKRSGKT